MTSNLHCASVGALTAYVFRYATAATIILIINTNLILILSLIKRYYSPTNTTTITTTTTSIQRDIDGMFTTEHSWVALINALFTVQKNSVCYKSFVLEYLSSR